MSDSSSSKYEVVSDNNRVSEVADILGKEAVISVDTETTGLDPYLSKVLLIQIATPYICYIFIVGKIDVKLLKPLLENPDIMKIVQNAKFDYKMLRCVCGISMNNMFCTMTAERLMIAGLFDENTMSKASLKSLTKKYLHMDMEKKIRSKFHENGDIQRTSFSKEEFDYAADDALVLHPIYEQQSVDLADRELIQTALLEFNTIPITGDMELEGCSIDTEKWRNIVEEVRKRRDEYANKILKVLSPVVAQATLFGLPAINISSPVQLLSCLKKFGVRRPDGSCLEDTDEDTLKEAKKGNPIIEDILQYRGDEKLVKAYGLNFLEKINKKTGRIHAEFDPLRAATGRYSSSHPNLQQIPTFDEKDPLVNFRSCFIAKPGYKFICSDYSQQELRILADASNDPVFARAYMNNEDRHKQTASDVFGVPLDKVTPKQRKIAKVLNFAIVYGAGPSKIAWMLEIPIEEASEIISRYFRSYPYIRRFMERMAEEAIRNRFAYTIIGRKRYFQIPDPSDPEYRMTISKLRRVAPNTFVQGSAADVTKQALIYLDEAIRENSIDAHLIMVIHDEVVIEVKEAQAERMARITEDCMIRGYTTFFKNIPMKVEAVVADYWCKA